MCALTVSMCALAVSMCALTYTTEMSAVEMYLLKYNYIDPIADGRFLSFLIHMCTNTHTHMHENIHAYVCVFIPIMYHIYIRTVTPKYIYQAAF